MSKTIEQRVLDLERRFYPIETCLYKSMKDEIEQEKKKDIDENGIEYHTQFTIETDKGIHSPKTFSVKAYSTVQAMYFANRDIVYPNMNKLKQEGKIRWWKINEKKCV
jgi:hypothetical protein